MQNPIEYLKGVGPLRGNLLKKELHIFTFEDLLNHFPYRHIDRTAISKINSINDNTEFIQVKGIITSVETIGSKHAKRLVATLKDDSGELELVWFQGIHWVEKMIHAGEQYLVYGRVSFFNYRPQISHPEFEKMTDELIEPKKYLEPVYSSTDKLNSKGLGGRQIAKLTAKLFEIISAKDLIEFLPDYIINKYRFPFRFNAYKNLHFPETNLDYDQAVRRLKFEELFISQLRIYKLKNNRYKFSKGILFEKVGDVFNNFYSNHLPFSLTNAQKKVLKEIRKDLGSGHQMNRLLQGDVGSGKTIVALMTMLIVIGNNYQTCMMAPTEILASQHFNSITKLLSDLTISVKLLTGSTKAAEKKEILQMAKDGSLNILIGTHALIEEKVQFKNLGLAIVDEQHRFGVEQRAKLWAKSEVLPHILVMTATPIPRTLAMTAYGDLDYSIMDEMPPGRKPIITVHRFDDQRAKVMDFIKLEIEKGRQAYIIFPLIEESSKLDYENLMRGYEEVKSFFPEPKYWISMVHGKQSSVVKETNMHRFIKRDTQIMVSTTVIEVGVDVPNATVVVIESAERFGLAQLHQLRGRVGRGGEQSFCILLTSRKLTLDAKQRLNIMTTSNNGFVIAEKDLELRGPGDIEGTRQSGILNFKLASIVADKAMLETARNEAEQILNNDADLNSAENLQLRNYLMSLKGKTEWSRIS